MATSLSLKSLLVPSKAATIDYPGFDGFQIQVAFLSREQLVKIRKKATKTEFKNRQPIETLDDDLFLKLYVAETIKGWSGLTLAILNQLAPIDISGQDETQELEFSDENALMLMKASANFDAFISETVTDLTAFTKASGIK